MTVKVISGPANWMEAGALRQLESIGRYPGAELVVGLPDLHGGRSPVGLVAEIRGHVYPYLIGGDIGCGMALFDPSIPRRRFRPERAARILSGLSGLGSASPPEGFGEPCPIRDFGSIGGGNHFVEFQAIEEVADQGALDLMGLEPGQVLVLVHSGSRGFGQEILEAFARETGYGAAEPEAKAYLGQHDRAVAWAARNRQAAAGNVVSALGLGGEPRLVLDHPHNHIEEHGGLLVHRKGAVSALRGPAVIAGSRGSFSYLVRPCPDSAQAGHSISHGAGRKWARSACRGRLSKKLGKDDLRRTALGSLVVCRDAELLFQEAPQAYKDIREVINVLVGHRLLTVLAVLRPLLTFKG
ncbi:MAG: RNA ligase RtcB family protein [Deltaproteobacteria bacterium]|nr:RNA ligase RtcB family protein [Deltaproteobacteria bacterium]